MLKIKPFYIRSGLEKILRTEFSVGKPVFSEKPALYKGTRQWRIEMTYFHCRVLALNNDTSLYNANKINENWKATEWMHTPSLEKG